MPDFELADLMMGPAGAAALGAVALSIAAGSYGIRTIRSGPAALPASVPGSAMRQLKVEMSDPDIVEAVAVSRGIADLMIADEWTEISRFMTEWEDRLASTPGGLRYHDVAADTCLSGLQGLIDDAPRDAFDDLGPALAELSHFVDTHTGTPGDHVLALLAARAHLAVGDAFRSGSWPEAQRREAYRRMARHYLAAGSILSAYDPLAYMSPLLAETHYRQAAGAPGGAHRLPEIFETWIDLDPANPRTYEIHATYHLSDPDLVSGAEIREGAELALSRTEETLGSGGYALFFRPLLAARPDARQEMDGELYVSALFDLASHDATQCDVNWVAGALADEIAGAPPAQAAGLRDVFHMLVTQDLKVLYPRIWNRSEAEVLSLVADVAGVGSGIYPTGKEEVFDRAA